MIARRCPLRRGLFVRGLALVTAIALRFPAGASADDSDPWGLDEWIPSLGLSIGVMTTGEVEGSVRAVDSDGAEIRTPNTGGAFATTPIAAVTLGLDTPALKRVPLKPALFVRASVIPTFTLERNVASEGAVGPFEPPESFSFTAPAIGGQGSQTEISTNLLAYSFSAGVAIPVEIGGHRFRVRPGVSWMRFEFDLRGDLHHAVKPVEFGTSFRAIALQGHGKLYLNGIGPYLELEALDGALQLADGVFVGFFAEAAAYRVLGDRRANVGVVANFDDAFGTETYTAHWRIEADEWFYRFGAGVRIYLDRRSR